MSKKRWLVFVLLIIALVLAVVGLVWYRGDYRPEPLTISLSDYPRYVNSPTVMLRGHISRDARIELKRNTSTLGTVYSQEKQFEAEVELEPGENFISILARTTTDIEPRVGETGVFIVWQPKSPPVPTLNPLPDTTNVSGITISGATYPNGNVEIVISPESEGSPETFYPKALKDGSFKTDVRLPAPGT